MRPSGLLWLVSVLLWAGCATVPGPDDVAQWANVHPPAAHAFVDWAHLHPEAAHLLFAWDARQPERSRDFVVWASTSQGPIEVYTAARPGWRHFDWMAESHRPATEAFLAWCRRFPEAAQTLVSYPTGLSRAGWYLAGIR